MAKSLTMIAVCDYEKVYPNIYLLFISILSAHNFSAVDGAFKLFLNLLNLIVSFRNARCISELGKQENTAFSSLQSSERF